MIIWKVKHTAREHIERLRITVLAEVTELHTEMMPYNPRICVTCNLEVQ